jgi:hypothetical protein
MLSLKSPAAGCHITTTIFMLKKFKMARRFTGMGGVKTKDAGNFC